MKDSRKCQAIDRSDNERTGLSEVESYDKLFLRAVELKRKTVRKSVKFIVNLIDSDVCLVKQQVFDHNYISYCLPKILGNFKAVIAFLQTSQIAHLNEKFVIKSNFQDKFKCKKKVFFLPFGSILFLSYTLFELSRSFQTF